MLTLRHCNLRQCCCRYPEGLANIFTTVLANQQAFCSLSKQKSFSKKIRLRKKALGFHIIYSQYKCGIGYYHRTEINLIHSSAYYSIFTLPPLDSKREKCTFEYRAAVCLLGCSRVFHASASQCSKRIVLAREHVWKLGVGLFDVLQYEWQKPRCGNSRPTGHLLGCRDDERKVEIFEPVLEISRRLSEKSHLICCLTTAKVKLSPSKIYP